MISQLDPGSEGLALKRLRFDQANGTLECLEFYLDAAAPEERVAVARAFAAAICSPEVRAGARSIGPYRVRRLLGRGAFGTVYAAEHEPSGHPVALKVLHEQYGTSSDVRRRFQREIECVLRVQHPNLVRVFHGEVNREDPFLVMDYVPGVSLADLIERSRSQNAAMLVVDSRSTPEAAFRDVVGVVEAVARAAAALHRAHVVHRDIKPRNIIVTPDGTPVLTDLGLAGLLGTDQSQLSSSGGVGTPAYMAPEQLSGAHGDARSDVWALGATLYECLTLERPYSGATRAELEKEVLSSPTPRARAVHPWLPPAVDEVLEATLAVEPRDRYEDAASLADDLARLRAGKPLLRAPPGPLARVGRWARRHTKLVLGAMVGLAVLAAVGFSVQQRALLKEREHTAAVLQRVVELTRSAIDAMVDGTTSLERSGFRLDERRKILLAATDQLASIHATGFEDPALLVLLAKASRELGDLEARAGDSPTAREHLARAVAVLDSLRVAAPSSELLAELSTSLVKLGDLEGRSGNTTERRALYERALTLDAELVRLNPGVSRHVSDLANSYARLGYLATQEKRLDDAARRLGQALEVQARLESLGPDNTVWLHDSAHFELLMTSNCLAREERDAAREHLTRATSLARRLVALAPTDARSHASLGVALAMTASDFAEQPEARLALSLEALSSAKTAAALAPDDPSMLRNLATAWMSLAGYELPVSGFEKALGDYDIAKSVLDEAARLDPTSRDAFFADVNLKLTMADSARRAGALEAASRYAETAILQARDKASDPAASEQCITDALRFLVDRRAGDSVDRELALALADAARRRLGSAGSGFEAAVAEIRRTDRR